MSDAATINDYPTINNRPYSLGGNKFAVFCTPLDMIEVPNMGATPVHVWLAAAEDARDLARRYEEFMAAVVEDRKLTNDELRCQPYVTYDMYNDGICFIFKHQNNGNTVLVGYGTPPVRPDDIFHGYVGGAPVGRWAP